MHTAVDTKSIKGILDQKQAVMKVWLAACARCSLCAESCFLFVRSERDPRYMPSYKVLHSLGRLYRRAGRVSRAELEQMRVLLWRNCVLCGRCYCPMGIDIPQMIALARAILRTQGIYGACPHSCSAPEEENA